MQLMDALTDVRFFNSAPEQRMAYIKFGTKTAFLLAEVIVLIVLFFMLDVDQQLVWWQLTEAPEPHIDQAFEDATRAYEEDLGGHELIG